MLETIKNAWKVKELRNKILFTFFIILIFRIGSVIPVPFVDIDGLRNLTTGANANEFFSYLSILTGGGLEYAAIFAMSVTPYINSSIIMQLLAVAIPALERLSKQGEEGQKKIAQITRYVTIGLGLIQGTAYFFYLKGSSLINVDGTGAMVFAAFVIILCFTAGSALVMWLGEQIDTKGIGNGISMLLFAGIISRAPDAAAYLWAYITVPGVVPKLIVAGIIIVFLAIIGFVVWMTNAERRIPVQYAKRVVGNKMYGGQNTHIPIKVNMSGVMPIIFASSILMLPTMILSFWKNADDYFFGKILALFSVQGIFYAIVYFFLIIGFAYFYTTIQYNPVEMANNLRKNGGSIPGIRPGKTTSDFIQKILSRITLMGALFLSLIAILPIIIGNVGGIQISLGGTSVLIIVGVALDTVQNLESQMMMRHYKGFLD
ncbi:MAG: preprotein translocase subunit SecY [Clostridia bacterium]|nr:preprotein translocase subunit SecY [Clostridia bacterium]